MKPDKNCLCNSLSRIGAIFMGIIRCLLFMACFFLVAQQVLNIWLSCTNVFYAELIGSAQFLGPVFNVANTMFMAAILLVLGAIGAHGAYNKDAKYLRWFACVLAVLSVAMIVLFVYYPANESGQFADYTKEIKGMMENYAKDYQYRKAMYDDANRATLTLDVVQFGLDCCGADGPQDWVIWRPGPTIMNKMPVSCCGNFTQPGEARCSPRSDNLHHAGCLDRVVTLVGIVYIIELIHWCYMLVLALVAALLAKYIDPSTNSCGCGPSSMASTNQYEKLNPHVQPTADGAPPMYPNCRCVERDHS